MNPSNTNGNASTLNTNANANATTNTNSNANSQSQQAGYANYSFVNSGYPSLTPEQQQQQQQQQWQQAQAAQWQQYYQYPQYYQSMMYAQNYGNAQYMQAAQAAQAAQYPMYSQGYMTGAASAQNVASQHIPQAMPQPMAQTMSTHRQPPPPPHAIKRQQGAQQQTQKQMIQSSSVFRPNTNPNRKINATNATMSGLPPQQGQENEQSSQSNGNKSLLYSHFVKSSDSSTATSNEMINQNNSENGTGKRTFSMNWNGNTPNSRNPPNIGNIGNTNNRSKSGTSNGNSSGMNDPQFRDWLNNSMRKFNQLYADSLLPDSRKQEIKRDYHQEMRLFLENVKRNNSVGSTNWQSMSHMPGNSSKLWDELRRSGKTERDGRKDRNIRGGGSGGRHNSYNKSYNTLNLRNERNDANYSESSTISPLSLKKDKDKRHKMNKSSKNKKSNKSHKKNKSKKTSKQFSWQDSSEDDDEDMIYNSKSTKRKRKSKKKQNSSSSNSSKSFMSDDSDEAQMERILRRKQRFEKHNNSNNSNNNNNNNSFTSRTKHNNYSNSHYNNNSNDSDDDGICVNFTWDKESENGDNNSQYSRHSYSLYGTNDQDWFREAVIGQSTKLEKSYFRLTSEPQAHEVRTLDTCKKAYSRLMNLWSKTQDYRYIGDQFKALRQDLKVQHIKTKFTICVYEDNAKICLQVADFSEYNQCQGQLKELYRLNPAFCKNFVEFLEYRLLYNAVTKNYAGINDILKENRQFLNHERIKIGLKIVRSLQRMDFETFFKCYENIDFYGRCVLDQIKFKVRYCALITIINSCSPMKYPLSRFKNLCLFKSIKECKQYLKDCHCSLIKIGNEWQIDCKSSKPNIIEYIPKAKDDATGVTHGSVYHDKQIDSSTISNFLIKNKGKE